MKKPNAQLFLYLMLAGVLVALPVTILLVNQTVISVNDSFNVYGVALLVSLVQYRWVRKTAGNVIASLYVLFGSATILTCLFFLLNFFIPSEGTKKEVHKVDSFSYSAGNVTVEFKDSAFADDPGMRRFDIKEVEKAPKDMEVYYTFRKGLFGFYLIEERIVK